MKTFRKELWFEVPTRRGFVNITGQVTDCLRESGIMRGHSTGECDAYYRLGFHQ